MAGRIQIRIEANVEGLKKGLDDGDKRVSSFKKQMVSAGKVAGVALAAAATAAVATATALAAMAKSTANAGDQFAKMSAKLGASTEFLSAFAHAADLSGVSTEKLEVGLGRMARVMSDVQNGLATAKRSFDDLNITVQNADGSLREIPEVMFEIADRLSGMTDATKKAALAQEIFGRSGIELIPLFNQGSAAIREQMEEAKRLGIVWSTDAALAAEAFNDNLTRLGKALDGVKFAIGNRLIPILDDLTVKLVAFVQTDEFRNWVRDVADAIAVLLPRAIGFAIQTFRALSIAVNGAAIGALTLSNAILAVNLAVFQGGKAIRDLLGIKESLGVTTEQVAAKIAELTASIETNRDTMRFLMEDIEASSQAFKDFSGLALPAIERVPPALKVVQEGVKQMSDELKRATKELTDGLIAAERGLADLEGQAAELAEQSAINTMKRAAEMKSFWQQQLEAIRDSAATTWSSISLSFSSALAGMIQGTATFREFLKSTFNTVLQAVIQLAIQMVTSWALAEATRTATTQAANATIAASNVATAAISASAIGAMAASVGAAIAGAASSTIAALIALWGVARAVLASIAAAMKATIFGIPVGIAITAALIAGSILVAGASKAAAAVLGGLALGTLGLTVFQKGGIVTGPTRALLGEAGPEAVIPLDRFDTAGGGEIHITVMLDENTLLKALVPNIPGFVRVRAGIRSA